MKRLILLLTIPLILAGCSLFKNNEKSPVDKEVCQVDSYLESAAAGNWPEVFNTLTGEALAGAKINAGQVKTAGGKIISKRFKATRVSDSLTQVSADFTKSTGAGFDREAYTFDLILSGDKWLIYKTAWGQYLHDHLTPGQLPAEAATVIKAYLEAPYIEKRQRDNVFLAGKLLQDSEIAKSQPVDVKEYGALQKTQTTVKDVECLGVSRDFAVARVTCDVTRDYTGKQIVLLINTVLVNGTWKIGNIENL